MKTKHVPRFELSNVRKADRERPAVFDAVGVCIYCGLASEKVGALTLEHIVPAGLGGGLLLRGASCVACARITQGFEQAVLRGPLLARRWRSGLVGHPKEIGPMLLRTVDVRTGKETSTRVPPTDYPDLLVLPELVEPPGFFLDRDLPLFCANFLHFGLEADLARFGVSADVQLLTTFDLTSFARMLAKIAHGLAIAELGPSGFEWWLPPSILGSNEGSLANFIGRWPTSAAKLDSDGSLHHVGIGITPPTPDGRSYAVARIRLFSTHEMSPDYAVLVGPLSMPRPPDT